MPRHKSWFWLAALAAACFFDFLFWKKPFGVSFVIWTTALLGVGYLLAWREGKRPAAVSILLSILVLAFAFVPAWRNEPFTRVFSVLLALSGMLLLTATFLSGHWPFYRMWDYLKEMTLAMVGGVSRAILMASKNQNPPPLDQPVKKSFGRKALPVLRGVLIAVPVVTLMAILLSSADPIFGDWLKKVLDLEKLPEYLFRLWYVLMIGSILVGIYLHAILPNKTEERPDPQKPWMRPFLGWTETGIILGAVDALFLAFVFIQIRYLFGGMVNINETGYTFSEYARRGFGELVAVAVLSMMLYLCLNTITKRENRGANLGFSVVSILLMANVLVILFSSLQRLLLYESAYGFSQLRTYTHVFIYWLGGLIVMTVILELLRKRGHFALALLISSIGFGATLAVMNVDAFIATQNVERATAGEELDIQYLSSLSVDAVPFMVDKYNDPTLTPKVKDALGSALACRQVLLDDPTKKSWQGFNLGETNAYRLLQENRKTWSQHNVFQSSDWGWSFRLNGVEIPCIGSVWMD
ncbi:MAG: hypothetical protein FD147_944 [Chloroflexi bacterium]|nr:MAG: hypothetical protein FD147_944 [Chloroflexota bacterium]